MTSLSPGPPCGRVVAGSLQEVVPESYGERVETRLTHCAILMDLAYVGP